MRILVFNWRDLAHPARGGAEVYTDAVAREWVKMGHEVTLFCAAVAGRPEREVWQESYNVIRQGTRHSVYRKAKAFWKKEGQGNFDLVIDEVNTRPFGCPKWVKNVPVVGLIHQVAKEIWSYEAPWPISIIGRYILEPYWLRTYREVSVVTLSESSKESLHEYGVKNVTIVPVGHEQDSNVTHLHVKKFDDPTVVFVGRLTPNKRPGDAVDAHRILRRSMPQAKLIVVGDGPLLADLRLKGAQGATFVGSVSQEKKIEIMSKAHVIVVTSVREGWGMVVNEAASLGTPAIAYDVPGLRDSVAACGGFLVQPTPQSLADALAKELPELIRCRRAIAAQSIQPWKDTAAQMLGMAPTCEEHARTSSNSQTIASPAFTSIASQPNPRGTIERAI